MGGGVCLPSGLGSTMESRRQETAMSLDYPTLALTSVLALAYWHKTN